MTHHRLFVAVGALVIAAFVPVGAVAQAGKWTSPAAITATKASPELTTALSKDIGGTSEEAAGAAGAMFGLAKSRLKADEFSQIAKVVPGMDALLKAAPAAGGSTGAAAGAMAALGGGASGLSSVISAFTKMGIKPEMVPKVASTLVSFVTKKGGSGGANLGNLLASALK